MPRIHADLAAAQAAMAMPMKNTMTAALICGGLFGFSTYLAAPVAARDVPGDFAGIVEEMSPAVVAITVRRAVQDDETQVDPDRLPPPLREFFERRGETMPQMPGMQEPQRPRQTRAVGSGFFVSEDGYIVTNNHVIADADEIEVIYGDEEVRSASLVGADPATDLAVLRIEPDMEVTVAPWGDSEAMQPGSWTIAIGSPFGLGGTVTIGVLSARSRDIRTGPYDDYLQTDAAINMGNSGGPLFNGAGEVIGVNTAIFSPTGASVGIGFAVPSLTAMNVVDQLIETGMVERGFLGVRLQEMTPALARAFEIDDAQGAVVVSVEPEGPADAGGLATGDVIRRFAEEPVEDPRALSRMVADVSPGTEVPVLVRRDGEDLRKTIETGLREPAEPLRTDDEPEPEHEVLGLALSPLPEVVQRQLAIDAEAQPAIVQRVRPAGAAAEAGIRQGDVIVQVDNRLLEGPGHVASAWRDALNEERPLLLRVLRDGDPLFIAVEPIG